MSRRKLIPQPVDTPYFKDVTPLWESPKGTDIPERYKTAVDLLVDWAGPEWASNEKTGYFLMRDMLTGACERWHGYDWAADESWIEERRSDAQQRPKLAKATLKFISALSSSPFRTQRHFLGLSVLTEFGATLSEPLTFGDGVAAISQSLEQFSNYISKSDKFSVRFGSVEFVAMPRALPQREIAVALALADLITFWRRDAHQCGTQDFPHKPRLSRNLPWQAIAEFASAHCLVAENLIDPSSIQTRIKSLVRNIKWVHC